MIELVEPENEDELTAAIADTVAEKRSLVVSGHGTKVGLGRPVEAQARLSVARLSGITHYAPGELVMEAGAATPLAEIEAALAESGQHLAFEPPDLGPLYGQPPAAGTIGGVIACNLSGARRPFAGAARDHVLGIRAVSGRGEVFASGGRVVKNVTGYDMSKLLAGSYGTLAVLSLVTFKVLPRAGATRTVLQFGETPAAAAATMEGALDGPWDISAAAYLPQTAAARSGVDYVVQAGGPVTALRLEGSREGVIERTRAMRTALAPSGETEELHAQRSRVFWAEIGSGVLLPAGNEGGDMLWRLSLPPAQGIAAGGRIQEALGGEVAFDWAGGLVWCAPAPVETPEAVDAGAQMLRRIAVGHGGHATLMRAPEAVRVRVPVFQPEEAALAALTRRVKENFDPRRVLNPGRMFEGL